MSVPRKRMSAQQRREYILRKAAEVFSRKGYRMASVSDIVEEAGVGRGTFYLYFDSKKEIFIALIEAYLQGFADVLEKNHSYLANALYSGNKVMKNWRDNMLRILEYHRDNPHLTIIAFREAMGRDEVFSEKAEELYRLAKKNLISDFQMMYERGMLRECDLNIVASIVLGSTINVIQDHLLIENGKDLESLADAIIEYHIRALVSGEDNIIKTLKSAFAIENARNVV